MPSMRVSISVAGENRETAPSLARAGSLDVSVQTTSPELFILPMTTGGQDATLMGYPNPGQDAVASDHCRHDLPFGQLSDNIWSVLAHAIFKVHHTNKVETGFNFVTS